MIVCWHHKRDTVETTKAKYRTTMVSINKTKLPVFAVTLRYVNVTSRAASQQFVACKRFDVMYTDTAKDMCLA